LLFSMLKTSLGGTSSFLALPAGTLSTTGAGAGALAGCAWEPQLSDAFCRHLQKHRASYVGRALLVMWHVTKRCIVCADIEVCSPAQRQTWQDFGIADYVKTCNCKTVVQPSLVERCKMVIAFPGAKEGAALVNVVIDQRFSQLHRAHRALHVAWPDPGRLRCSTACLVPVPCHAPLCPLSLNTAPRPLRRRPAAFSFV
jgi:hypothetical protein